MVQWKEQAENWYPEGKQNVLPGPSSDTVVSGLRPWTVYHLRVFAENQVKKRNNCPFEMYCKETCDYNKVEKAL